MCLAEKEHSISDALSEQAEFHEGITLLYLCYSTIGQPFDAAVDAMHHLVALNCWRSRREHIVTEIALICDNIRSLASRTSFKSVLITQMWPIEG